MLALGLSGCLSAGAPQFASLPTPPDPPPLPGRKPLPPEGSAVAAAAEARARQAAPAPIVTSAPLTRVEAVAKPAAPPAASPANLVAYAVQSGDTVHSIARRLSVPLRSIIDANGLAPPYVVRPRQVLRIPNPRKHVVAPGDTVYGVSRRYGVEVTELVRLNQIDPPYTIAAGQDLILPVPAQPAGSIGQITVARAGAPAVVEAAAQVPPSRPVAPGPQSAALSPPPLPEPAAQPAAIPTPPPRSDGKFLWPVRGSLIATYGPKGGGLHNDGINIAAPRGAPVFAAENGVVVYSGNELRGFGNLILIKHADGWVTAYAHNEELLVRRGDTVERGQVIAKVGSSGNVSTPQLHFEIRRGTRAVDPGRLLGPQAAALGSAG